MLTRRSLLAAPAAFAAATLPFAPAFARASLAGAETPPVYRFKLGAFTVTAVTDGTLGLETDLFPEAQRQPQEAARLLGQAALPTQGPIRTFVNAYAVDTGDRLALIDTGLGPAPGFGPDLGRLPKNLAAAGLDPAAVDLVVLTHLHPDHVGGLTSGGQRAFPNAELVVSEADYAFWMDEGTASRAPADAQPFFAFARDALKPYAGRIRRAAPGEIVPGLTLEAAPGHTPGHALVRVASDGAQLLVWGDVVHAVALQFPHPDWSLAFDTDQAQAAASRKRVFDQAATDRLLIAGMHLPFPGVGYVARRIESYAYVPQSWPSIE
jgi:glyoxylase-like metal-dependent hydrolase (beta-lactamase superfamily II)